MSAILINSKPVNGPEQFAQMIQEALSRRPARFIRTVDLDGIIARLIEFRQGFEEDQEEEKSLIDQTASVGLMLIDFAGLLGLDEDDTARVLGPELVRDYADLQEAPIQLTPEGLEVGRGDMPSRKS